MPTPLDFELMGRILLAGLLGAVVGYEREVRRRPAGLRTFMLVSIGAALFTIASIYGFPPGDRWTTDPSRVAAQVVTGIGFIGAGIVLRQAEGIVIGLTTAAGVWAVAAIGVAIGAGMYWLAIFTTIVVVAVLFVVRGWEEQIRRRNRDGG